MRIGQHCQARSITRSAAPATLAGGSAPVRSFRRAKGLKRGLRIVTPGPRDPQSRYIWRHGGLDLIGKAAVLKTAGGNPFRVRIPGPPLSILNAFVGDSTIWGRVLETPMGTAADPRARRAGCAARLRATAEGRRAHQAGGGVRRYPSPGRPRSGWDRRRCSDAVPVGARRALYRGKFTAGELGIACAKRVSGGVSREGT
jgi:hypothetical protein